MYLVTFTKDISSILQDKLESSFGFKLVFFCFTYSKSLEVWFFLTLIAKGRPGPSIPGRSDFLSDCFKLKLKRWRITWYHQKPLNRKLNAYWSRFKIVEIPVRVSSDTQNRTDRDQSKKVRLHFLLKIIFQLKCFFFLNEIILHEFKEQITLHQITRRTDYTATSKNKADLHWRLRPFFLFMDQKILHTKLLVVDGHLRRRNPK